MIPACLPRSSSTTHGIVEQLDPARRYLPEDLNGDGSKETKCNWFAADACQAHGVELPGQLPGDRVKSREQIAWLASEAGKAAGWRKVTAAEALELVKLGAVVLATWINPIVAAPCHIALGVLELPTTDARKLRHTGENWIAQAGGSCFNNGPATDGFGSKVVEWYAHA